MSALDSQVATMLAEKDVRYTRARRLVVEALDGADGPRTAAQIHSSVSGDVPLSSLYRTLTVLEVAGVVVPHTGAKGVVHYELAEWITGHHHHLVCLKCGTIEDVDVPGSFEKSMEKMVSKVGSQSGFTAVDHSLEIHGVCGACA